ncbi:MAG: fibrobacter succinogenes major paralogous domain-containing protein [Bacteroidetes bacterium]|nr:fibrobacter succinogenes major paralogous domain-containing protein [Bacteroidota bacterium]
MKKLNLILFALIIISMPFLSCKKVLEAAFYGEPVPKETQIKIGENWWMQYNLSRTRFRNGDLIGEARTNEEWLKAGEEGKPAWCYYQNESDNDQKYGKLYNWYAVNDSRGLAPDGWHIPSDAEWTALENFLGGAQVAGTKMKSTSGWKRNDMNTNESGFTGMPGGRRSSDGSFVNEGEGGYWWSATENGSNAWFRMLSFSNTFVYRSSTGKNRGLSVRCIRD